MSTALSEAPLAAVAHWERQETAQSVYLDTIDRLLEACPQARSFAQRLLHDTAIRLIDIVDHLILADEAMVFGLAQAGWRQDGGVFRNAAGHFPPVLRGGRSAIMIRVESIDQFIRVRGLAVTPQGAPFSPLRQAVAFESAQAALGVVERNGATGFAVEEIGPDSIRQGRLFLNAFRARRRHFDTVEQGLTAVETLVDQAVSAIGPHRACAFWLMAERDNWMRRCAAGRLQKARQDAIGVGWCNIDHHTYDGSRQHFRHTIRILEKLGYVRREMLYAGELAGWGSQVLEQPVIGSTIFADVDLAPEELSVDFARDILPELPCHRRAGLLSELLGESILEAGLNHVAGLYDQRLLRAQLAARSVQMMPPFTDWPHLYQELTEGDWDVVDPSRVDRLERGGHINAVEAEKLRLNGSMVTHLENIERNHGYKGFNREGIDSVLRKLDPRAYSGQAPTSLA
jgi:hypothetical protein